MIDLGIRLKEAIKNSKYTQKNIAELINTSQRALSFYMQGKAAITVETLKKICDLIDVPIQDIVNGIDNNNFDEMILRKIKNLNDEQKKVIIEQIEFLEMKNNQMSYTSVNTPNSESKIKNSG